MRLETGPADRAAVRREALLRQSDVAGRPEDTPHLTGRRFHPDSADPVAVLVTQPHH